MGGGGQGGWSLERATQEGVTSWRRAAFGFSLFVFLFEPQSGRLLGFKQQLSEHLEPRLRFCRNAEAHRCVLHDPSQARRRLSV